MYEPVEGIYWHPGTISYTFFYALGLWMLGLMLQLMQHTAWHRRLLCFVPAFILAPIVGGSNYSTALVAAMLLFFAGNLPVLEKATAKCGALLDRARVVGGSAAGQHPCAGKCLAAGVCGRGKRY